MWIKVHYNNKMFSPLWNFQILQYLPHNYLLKTLRKVKILKDPMGFELMSYRSGLNPLIHCATLLDGIFGREAIKLYTSFYCLLQYINNTSQHGSRCPIPH